MKILWVINLMIPAIAEQYGIQASNREGWLSGVFDSFATQETGDYELAVAFPVSDAKYVNNNSPILVRGIACYPFYEDLSHPELYNAGLDDQFLRIINSFSPDILHVAGTEFPHGLSAARAFNNPERTLVTIQGICRKIADDYMAEIPAYVKNRVTFRDWLKNDSIISQQERFFKRAKNETELLTLSKHIGGRTDFDRNYAGEVNPTALYHKLNETMRGAFYGEDLKWEYVNARPHSIFIGQGDYPIKGLHFLLEAAGMLVKEYPDLSINIAGNSIIEHKSIKDRLKTPSYGAYLRRLIKRNGLKGRVCATGPLSEQEMIEKYLSASIFICSSYVENSPNTVAEAMLIGMPVVASDAGGITSVISGEEGMIFHRGDASALAENIRTIWSMEDGNDEKIVSLCKKAKKRALRDYDRKANHDALLAVYDGMME